MKSSRRSRSSRAGRQFAGRRRKHPKARRREIAPAGEECERAGRRSDGATRLPQEARQEKPIPRRRQCCARIEWPKSRPQASTIRFARVRHGLAPRSARNAFSSRARNSRRFDGPRHPRFPTPARPYPVAQTTTPAPQRVAREPLRIGRAKIRSGVWDPHPDERATGAARGANAPAQAGLRVAEGERTAAEARARLCRAGAGARAASVGERAFRSGRSP